MSLHSISSLSPLPKMNHGMSRMVWVVSGFLSSCLLLSFMFPSLSYSAAFRIYDQGASATAQSGAFTAQADDASAVYFNPAGMTQLPGLQLSLGTTLAGGGTDFTSTSGATSEGNFGGTIAFPPPSNLYVTANLKDLGVNFLGETTLGLGALSPFGVIYEYPNTTPFATAITRTTLELIDIKPTIAYKVNDALSLGLGADIYTFFDFWGEGQAETHFISSGGPGLPPAGTNMEVNGSDTAAGFNASVLFTPIRTNDGKPIVNFGLVYRSRITLQLDGDFRANGALLANSSTTLVLPQVITVGMAVWPVRNADREWKLELDVDFTGWKSFRNLDVRLSNGTIIQFPQNWSSTFTVMIGSEYKWLNPTILPHWDIALRGGYWYSESPMPDQTFNPTFPSDADNHSLSLGLGLTCQGQGKFLGFIDCDPGGGHSFWPKSIGMDVAYQALIYEKRIVTGATNPVAIPGVLNGTYNTTFHVGAINIRLGF